MVGPFVDELLLPWLWGGALVVIGVWMMFRSDRWTADRYFDRDAMTPALAEVFDRRKELEAFPTAVWQVIGAVALLGGVAAMARWISAALAFSIVSCVCRGSWPLRTSDWGVAANAGAHRSFRGNSARC